MIGDEIADRLFSDLPADQRGARRHSGSRYG
jgi:hypothetical protein